jgi:outer membrane protein OmpA-like peptidoglycan-associated protein
MNIGTKIVRTTLVAAAVAAAIAACASAPLKPVGAAEARDRLTQLQSDPTLANRAPVAMQAAEAAVALAEQPQANTDLSAYRVYVADRKVDIARAQAETKLAEEQRFALEAQREKARLDARTRELEVAKRQTATARADSADQRQAANVARGEANDANLAAASSDQQASLARGEAATANMAAANSDQRASDARAEANTANLAAADSSQQASDARGEAQAANVAAANSNQQASEARGEADTANLAAAASQRQAAELQQQIDVLQARPTDRGLVVTLGDVLFATGGARLRSGSSGNLNKLVVFLDRYPTRTASIEGYTDSVGSDEGNLALSQRRAESVMAYLVGQGIGSNRLTASGKGNSSPVAGNDSAAGRQENRRVEVVIENPPVG